MTLDRGSITIEFLLVLPFVAVALVTLIGVAGALQLKRQAMTIAEFAALYAQSGGGQRDAERGAQASGRAWKIEQKPQGEDFLHLLQLDAQGNSDVVSLLTQTLVGGHTSGETTFCATADPENPWVQHLLSGKAVSANYVIPLGFWDSKECGALTSILKDQVQIAGVSLVP